MNARHIDALVAEHVMGFKSANGNINQDKWDFSRFPAKRIRSIPNYSTDISAAWEVVERLKFTSEARGWGVMIGAMPDGKYQCWLASRDCEWAKINTYADTAPLAICFAALKAKGVDIPGLTD